METREAELSKDVLRLGREAVARRSTGDAGGARAKLVERHRAQVLALPCVCLPVLTAGTSPVQAEEAGQAAGGPDARRQSAGGHQELRTCPPLQCWWCASLTQLTPGARQGDHAEPQGVHGGHEEGGRHRGRAGRRAGTCLCQVCSRLPVDTHAGRSWTSSTPR